MFRSQAAAGSPFLADLDRMSAWLGLSRRPLRMPEGRLAGRLTPFKKTSGSAVGAFVVDGGDTTPLTPDQVIPSGRQLYQTADHPHGTLGQSAEPDLTFEGDVQPLDAVSHPFPALHEPYDAVDREAKAEKRRVYLGPEAAGGWLAFLLRHWDGDVRQERSRQLLHPAGDRPDWRQAAHESPAPALS
ncbi:uncharacterized protein LOC119103937 [Pollicipes pollicipes]|uniref:uncharacterized protein LOC119103937 n=1 Tax=Pollicipes pollicipes TaxID=41117 RepID=UPI00188518A7|nr:uncharacterized protein LOC119103937 [Pollicipes pollicipes]